MLTPISPALTGPSASTGSDAITFMSGSGTAPGIITTGSSPGRQRSMLSGEPSEEPKNRLEVLNEKLSRRGSGASATCDGSPALLNPSSGLSSSGFGSSDIDTSYCGSGGALSAASSSGSSGARSTDGTAAAVLAPATEAFDVEGSSIAGALPGGIALSAGAGGATTRRSPFSVRST